MSLKRPLALLLILIPVLTFMPISAFASSTIYSDTSGHWAEEAIVRWSELGVLQGSGGQFRPDDYISRAELAAIINRIMGFPKTAEKLFTDTAGKWYEADVNAVSLQSIYIAVKGEALGDQALTREEAVEMMYRAYVSCAVKLMFLLKCTM